MAEQKKDQAPKSAGFPAVNLTKNQPDSHSLNPSWCVAFVRFKEPSAMHSPSVGVFEEDTLMVIENDCVQVSITNPKNSFAKTCSLMMKLGDTWYQNAVSPGDWAFVWMANEQDDIDEIVKSLYGTGTKSLCNYYSGLKFVGRVVGVDDSDSVSSSGQRALNQTVHCQAFMEMNNSIYYTFVAQNVLTAGNDKNLPVAGQNFVRKSYEQIQSNGMGAALTNMAQLFENYYSTSADASPEAIIGMLFVIVMGIDNDKNLANSLGSIKGTFSDAIGIPKRVASILGTPSADKLWQLYTVYLGLQKYSPKNTLAASLSPDFTEVTKDTKNAVFYRTPYQTKGFVPFYFPPIWDNNNLWGILNQFLHPVVNEMYTALRLNKDGLIKPSLIVREKPFSTGLYSHLFEVAPEIEKIQGKTPESSELAKKIQEDVKKIKEELPKSEIKDTRDQNDLKGAGTQRIKSEFTDSQDKIERTYYYNLPRWVVDESLIKNIRTSTDEAARVNFVQIWGRSKGAEFTGAQINSELWKVLQLMSPNYVADEIDIKRHGLRAAIATSEFDMPSSTLGTQTGIYCRMNADWLFNGHLKLSGTVTLSGIQEPIVEGDNVQIRGILYHIESVSHNGSLASSGQKNFTTTLTLSNGVLANSLTSPKSIPQYVKDLPDTRLAMDLKISKNLPGGIDIQATRYEKGRSPITGEETKAPAPTPKSSPKKKKKTPSKIKGKKR